MGGNDLMQIVLRSLLHRYHLYCSDILGITLILISYLEASLGGP